MRFRPSRTPWVKVLMGKSLTNWWACKVCPCCFVRRVYHLNVLQKRLLGGPIQHDQAWPATAKQLRKLFATMVEWISRVDLQLVTASVDVRNPFRKKTYFQKRGRRKWKVEIELTVLIFFQMLNHPFLASSNYTNRSKQLGMFNQQLSLASISIFQGYIIHLWTTLDIPFEILVVTHKRFSQSAEMHPVQGGAIELLPPDWSYRWR